jgi:hypothetical protein
MNAKRLLNLLEHVQEQLWSAREELNDIEDDHGASYAMGRIDAIHADLKKEIYRVKGELSAELIDEKIKEKIKQQEPKQ